MFHNIPSGRIYAEVHGTGHPLVFISGLGGRMSFWTPQIKPFAEHFQIIAYDHIGTGQSDKPVIDYSVKQMADDVIALLDALGVERAHMVGHSTGGAIIQQIMVADPDRLAKPVLSATWAGHHPYVQECFTLRKQILESLGAASYMTDGTFRAHPPAYLARNPQLISSNLEDRLASFPGVEIERRRLNAVMAFDLRDHMSTIRPDSLLICAKDDQIIPYTLSEEIAAQVPGIKTHWLEYGGHFCPRVVPEEYRAAVLDYLLQDN